eukprot:1828334-Amphidinium_carterae.1
MPCRHNANDFATGWKKRQNQGSGGEYSETAHTDAWCCARPRWKFYRIGTRIEAKLWKASSSSKSWRHHPRSDSRGIYNKESTARGDSMPEGALVVS